LQGEKCGKTKASQETYCAKIYKERASSFKAGEVKMIKVLFSSVVVLRDMIQGVYIMSNSEGLISRPYLIYNFPFQY